MPLGVTHYGISLAKYCLLPATYGRQVTPLQKTKAVLSCPVLSWGYIVCAYVCVVIIVKPLTLAVIGAMANKTSDEQRRRIVEKYDMVSWMLIIIGIY